MSDLEEIQQLSDTELGQKIASSLSLLTEDDGIWYLDMDDHYIFCEDVPRDLSVLAVVEKLVVETVGHILYSTALHHVLFGYERDDMVLISHIIMMTARKKAESCLLALKIYTLETHAFEEKTPVHSIYLRA